MKPYHKNPRQITKKKLAKLNDTMTRLGDLSGIVHNLRTDEIIGGNQRTNVFAGATEIQLVEQYEKPDKQGTIAHGFIIWQGQKFAYRQVDWDEKTAAEANLVANMSAGEWDWERLANEWQPEDLQEWGFDENTFRDWKINAGALGNLLESQDPDEMWEGMPEFDQDDKTSYRRIIIHFMNEQDVTNFAELIEQNITDKTKYLYYPKQELLDMDSIIYYDQS